MTNYPFDSTLVIDAISLTTVANGQVYIYATSDVDNTQPLILTDPNGLPLTNPLFSNSNAFIPAFAVDVPQVKWVGGGFSGYFSSFEGLRVEAAAAAVAAQAAIGSSAAAEASAAAAEVAATSAAADALAAATAAGATNVALDTDGVPFFLA